MVGMGMRLEQPFQTKAVRMHIIDQPIGAFIPRASRSLVEIHHAVDNRGAFARWIMNNVRGSEGRLVEEALHDRRPPLTAPRPGDLLLCLFEMSVRPHDVLREVTLKQPPNRSH